MIICSECHGNVSDTAATCPHCGAPVAIQLGATASAQDTASADREKAGSTWWKWVIGVPVGLFVLFIVIGLAGGWNTQAGSYSSKAARIDAECEKMLSDSVPGTQRQMTRQVCDKMKADARK